MENELKIALALFLYVGSYVSIFIVFIQVIRFLNNMAFRKKIKTAMTRSELSFENFMACAKHHQVLYETRDKELNRCLSLATANVSPYADREGNIKSLITRNESSEYLSNIPRKHFLTLDSLYGKNPDMKNEIDSLAIEIQSNFLPKGVKYYFWYFFSFIAGAASIAGLYIALFPF